MLTLCIGRRFRIDEGIGKEGWKCSSLEWMFATMGLKFVRVHAYFPVVRYIYCASYRSFVVPCFLLHFYPYYGCATTMRLRLFSHRSGCGFPLQLSFLHYNIATMFVLDLLPAFRLPVANSSRQWLWIINTSGS